MRKFGVAAALLYLVSIGGASAQDAAASTQAMDQLVATDAQGWMFNRYDIGSMHNVQVVAQTDTALVVYGEYTYNGGSAGWVRARFDNGQFTCIEFWDFQGRCRALGQSPSREVVAGVLALAVVGAVAGAASSGGGGGSQADQQRQYRPEDYPRQPERQDDPPPPPEPRTPPIGGEGGLYGCAAPPCW